MNMECTVIIRLFYGDSCKLGLAPSVTSISIICPSLHTVSGTISPTCVACCRYPSISSIFLTSLSFIAKITSPPSVISLPSSCTGVSPPRIPALSAGPPGSASILKILSAHQDLLPLLFQVSCLFQRLPARDAQRCLSLSIPELSRLLRLKELQILLLQNLLS